jgi:hypothetical protein
MTTTASKDETTGATKTIRFRQMPGDKCGSVLWFAMIDCPICMSTFSSGEFLPNMRQAAEIAKSGLADHKALYPHCKRPSFVGGK